MPEADSTRKRSRSPSDSDQPKHKRANTGTTTDDSQARISQGSVSSATTLQREVKTDPRDDTAASTPSPRQTSDKLGTTMADPSTEAGSSTDPGTLPYIYTGLLVVVVALLLTTVAQRLPQPISICAA